MISFFVKKERGIMYKQRVPTKLTDRSKASIEQRKKVYRKRTLDEVRKCIHISSNICGDENSENQDPAQKIVDTAVDSARTAGDVVRSGVQKYSSKLKSEPGTAKSKHSSALKPEKIKKEAMKQKAESKKETAKKMQKKKIKKDYAKAAREAKKAAKSGQGAGSAGKKLAEKGSDLVSAAMQKIGQFIAEHPMGCATAALIFVVILTTISAVSSLGIIFSGPSDGAIAGSFIAKESDIKAVENAYASLESDLSKGMKLKQIKKSYPGYDEYDLDIDDIGHDAYELAAYLTIKYDDYNKRSTEDELTSLFSSQYKLKTKKVKETRYRQEERNGEREVIDYDNRGFEIGSHMEEYTYYVWVAYDYYILKVTLDNKDLDSVIRGKLTDDEITRYEYLVSVKGGMPDLW